MIRLVKPFGGQVQIVALLVLAVCILVVVTIIPILPLVSVRAAIARVESAGYVVLTSVQYDTLNSKLDSIALKANLAVTNAEAAVVAAQIAAAKVDLYNSARRYVFPDTSNVVITLAAPAAADTFSNWVEIVDSNAVTLSSKFALANGYLDEMMVEDFSAIGKSYIVEIAYGGAKVPVAVKRFLAENEGQELQIRSYLIPAGEVLYYRMMCETALATCEVCFRYFFE